METWAIVTLVLGASAISSLLTFFITKMQVRHSDKRFETELKRQREVESRQRRWAVRDAPLLKLRDELALMASKQDKLLATVSQWITTTKTEEEVKRERQDAIDDFNAYLASGDYAQTLFMQDATDIVHKAEEIRNDYKEIFYVHIFNINKLADAEAMKQAMVLSKGVRTKIVEVQELINKRLEEL